MKAHSGDWNTGHFHTLMKTHSCKKSSGTEHPTQEPLTIFKSLCCGVFVRVNHSTDSRHLHMLSQAGKRRSRTNTPCGLYETHEWTVLSWWGTNVLNKLKKKRKRWIHQKWTAAFKSLESGFLPLPAKLIPQWVSVLSWAKHNGCWTIKIRSFRAHKSVGM